jgi:hypothetical protein
VFLILKAIINSNKFLWSWLFKTNTLDALSQDLKGYSERPFESLPKDTDKL